MSRAFPVSPGRQLCLPRGIPARRRARPAVVEMKVGRVLPGTTMPSVGVEVTDEVLPLAAEEISLLQKMQPAHVQVRATMGDAAAQVEQQQQQHAGEVDSMCVAQRGDSVNRLRYCAKAAGVVGMRRVCWGLI